MSNFKIVPGPSLNSKLWEDEEEGWLWRYNGKKGTVVYLKCNVPFCQASSKVVDDSILVKLCREHSHGAETQVISYG